MSHTDDNAGITGGDHDICTGAKTARKVGSSDVTPIDDGETLFRRIHLGCGGYASSTQANAGHFFQGKGVSISSQAFADRKFEPSVDRELLCPADPRELWTQESEEHGVAALNTGKVRQIDSVKQNDEKGRLVQKYDVAVEHRPIYDDPTTRDNPAHSVVLTNPHCKGRKGAFKRLLEGLANIATWRILPSDVREVKS